MGAVLHGPGEGEHHGMGPSELFIKATSEDTGGSFFLSETTVAPGFPGPPLHRHSKLTDMFYVLEGTLTIQVEDEVHEAGPGTFACFPPGVAHTFRNESDAPARFLNFNTPGGFEGYMRELAEQMKTGEFDPAAVGRIAAKYDTQLA